MTYTKKIAPYYYVSPPSESNSERIASSNVSIDDEDYGFDFQKTSENPIPISFKDTDKPVWKAEKGDTSFKFGNAGTFEDNATYNNLGFKAAIGYLTETEIRAAHKGQKINDYRGKERAGQMVLLRFDDSFKELPPLTILPNSGVRNFGITRVPKDAKVTYQILDLPDGKKETVIAITANGKTKTIITDTTNLPELLAFCRNFPPTQKPTNDLPGLTPPRKDTSVSAED